MADGGFKKQLARATLGIRAGLGLAAAPPPARFTQLRGEAGPPPAPRGPFDVRLNAVEIDLARLTTGWDQHIPQLLDAVSIARSEARGSHVAHDRVDALRQDMDRLTARLELNLIDLKKQIGTSAQNKAGDSVQIISLGRVAQAVSTELKLHLMGDDVPLAGFVNVSPHGLPGADVVAPVDAVLPFGGGVTRAITVADSWPLESDLTSMFKRWLALLSPGGTLRIERFDLTATLDLIAAGKADAAGLAAALRESGRRASPAGSSLDALVEAARDAGFAKIRVMARTDGPGEVMTAERPEEGSS